MCRHFNLGTPEDSFRRYYQISLMLNSVSGKVIYLQGVCLQVLKEAEMYASCYQYDP